MILHSARVENFKGIRGPLEVSFNPDLPNLLEGPNGAGKSTLVEAIQCALVENHNTAGASAEQMRPRETALTPSIAVVFEKSGTVYRISKTFLDSPKALLERRRPDGAFDGIAKGRAADGTWTVLRDWELMRRLNSILGSISALRRSGGRVEDGGPVKAGITAAVSAMEQAISMLRLDFRVPFLETVAVLWPCADGSAQTSEEPKPGTDVLDDLLE